MKNNHHLFIALLAVLLILLGTTRSITSSFASVEDKLTPKEVIAKHLESIGSQEARNSIKNRVMTGDGQYVVKSGQLGRLQGPALLVSDNKKVLVGMNFGHATYPYEQLGYDGRKLTVAYLAPGVRSSLGNFLITEDVAFREGLFSGVLSSAWPLLDENWNNSRIEYAGSRKVDGQQVHELRYYPKKSTDSQIKLSFDATTFQHTRTEYSKAISAQLGATADQSAQQRETRFTLVEQYSDFKKVSGLTLPHSYKIELVVAGKGPTYTGQWIVNLSRFQFNQQIPADSFNVEKAAAEKK